MSRIVILSLTSIGLVGCPAAPRDAVDAPALSPEPARPVPSPVRAHQDEPVYGLCPADWPTRETDDATLCWLPDAPGECAAPCCIAPPADDRRCTSDDECVRIHADCGRSCTCTGVRADRADAWELRLAECTRCEAGVCNYECMWEDARCIDGACRSVRVEMPVVGGESHEAARRREARRAFEIGHAAAAEGRLARARVQLERARMLGDERAAADLARVHDQLAARASSPAAKRLHEAVAAQLRER